MLRNFRIALLAAAAVALSAVSSTHAAKITFGPNTPETTSAADISNAGSAAQAYTYTGGTPTINGVTFTDAGGGAFGGGHSQGYGTNGTTDSGYAALQTSGDYVDNTSPETLTFTGLASSEKYQIQVLVSDYRTTCCGGLRIEAVAGDAGGTNGILKYSGPGTDNVQSPGSGSFVIGTFTTGAAETTQALNFLGGNIQLNGVVIRDLGAAPEPASLSLFGLAGLGVLIRRRRQA